MDLVKQCAQTVLRVAKQILTDLTPGQTDSDPDTDSDADDLAELREPAGLHMAAA
jgi:hypothetical protein